jgi:hypothetical protein
MSKIAVAAIALFLVCTRRATVAVDAVLSPVAWKPSNPPVLNEQSCWGPGMERNIGIGELSCDAVGR